MTGKYVDCTNQAELDAAVAAGEVARARTGLYTASGSATVRASGSASVTAYGSATVRASDSATVRAYDSATVRAYDSATVTAYGSATVRAYDSATVHAYDSATVRASGSATVHASGSASVHAYGSATVRASKHVAVHKHGNRTTVTGGVIIDVPKITTVTDWADYHDLPIADGWLTVYKAVRADLRSAHGATYTIGEETVAPDWRAVAACGEGLHFSEHPHGASYYDEEATRFLRCRVPVDEAVLLDGTKVKARRCVVECEVDVLGRELADTEVAP